MSDKLHVCVDKQETGVLLKEDDEYIFSYSSDDPMHFISLTMPPRQKDYVHHTLHPIFEMHLPEGYLLSIIKKHFSKILKLDAMGLLSLMSKSIYGRVTYTTQNEVASETLSLQELLHPKDEKLFNELVSRFALHSALSGVQPKVLALVQDKASLRLEQYIVKSWGDDYPQLALNEYYCMRVALLSGLEVADFHLSDDDRLFIMKRFDLLDSGASLGFEDMCVLQAKQSDEKYIGTYESIAKTIKSFVSPKHKRRALQDFFKMLVVNTLVQNGDAHLKNFGLLYKNKEDIWLAPAYDIVSTTVYINNDIAALNLMGSKKWWSQKALTNFAQQNCSLSLQEARKIYLQTFNALQKVIHEIQERLISEKESSKQQVLKAMLTTFKEATCHS